IRIARKSQRMSMDNLVERMGNRAISKNSISRIERGLLRPSIHTLRAIADACKVPLSYFYDDDVYIGELDFRFAKDTPIKIAEQI
ncbi:helix-turn-helix domain-containing protein, partial [Xanthomonas citri pv. citri]|nr:helix-turn-helix domain-containing protein [Xanthomonas citri pv. citri]